MFKEIRLKILNHFGVWIGNKKDIPIGLDYVYDLKYQLQINPSYILEVGAKHGDLTKRCSACFPEAKIFSLEPASVPFKGLQQNFASYKNVSTHQIGLGSTNRKEMLFVYNSRKQKRNELISNNLDVGDHEEVEISTGDSFLYNNSIPHIDVLKLDADGYEMEILEGLDVTLNARKIKCIFTIVGFKKEATVNPYFPEILEKLNSLDFVFYGFYNYYKNNLPEKNIAKALFVQKGCLMNSD